MNGKTDWKRWNWLVGIAGICAVVFYVVWISDILADDPMEEISEPAVEEKADKVASSKAETKTEPAVAAPVKMYEGLSQDDAIKLAVKDAMADDNYISHYIEDNTLWLTVKMDDNWTSNMMRKGGLMDSLAIAELVTEHSILGDLNEINIAFKAELTDAYGNVDIDTVIEVGFTSETLAKINYENVLHENVPTIADHYWQHPTFK